jgi:hypothetical protein
MAKRNDRRGELVGNYLNFIERSKEPAAAIAHRDVATFPVNGNDPANARIWVALFVSGRKRKT